MNSRISLTIFLQIVKLSTSLGGPAYQLFRNKLGNANIYFHDSYFHGNMILDAVGQCYRQRNQAILNRKIQEK